jgi:replicative DNA helicase
LSQQGLPSNLEAERALLGAVMANNDLADEALTALGDRDFYSPAHQRVFRAMRSLQQDGTVVDPVTVTELLHRRGELEASGGAEYVSDLLSGIPLLSSADHYIQIIKQHSLRRQVISTANRIMVEAYSGADDAGVLLARAEQSILEVGGQLLRTTMVPMSELAPETLKTFQGLVDRKSSVTGIATKFVDLDEMTSGLQPSDLVILAARPSVGKTAFALSMALNAAKEGKTVAFFSLEMSAEQLFFRLLSMESKVDLQLLRRGMVSKGKLAEVGMCFDTLAALPVFVDDSPVLTVLEMGAKLRRIKSGRGLDLVLVDYLQLMSGVGRQENRNQEVSAVSRGLKAVAKELQVPVVALSQLSRAPEKRGEGKEPILSDLRDSGSIEQDADLVMFLHRNTANRDDPEARSQARLIVAKQRNGPTGHIRLAFLEHLAQFANATHGFAEDE